MDFDIIPYEDIVWGKRLGAGSFGSVFKGNYLGIDIAIKEVLPSTEYDMHKYFEREWRIMRECRHPNIVLFLGLSRAPEDDGRVFIISEFVPRGNLRQFILSSIPFPWRLRLSFATDVARAVAYLHARQCIHRDLKGENLLITSNDRIKVTDFGFARIASKNAEEMKRMTYCGTDGYMSPEIINGFDFDLPTDVFSLGIIFIEIMSRRLVDSKTYTRLAPSFTPDPSEVRRRASRGCPPALVDLALECCLEDPISRPRMSEVLTRLREIELEVLNCLSDDKEGTEHVGSIRLIRHGGKRAMPIFDRDPKDVAAELKEAAIEAEAESGIEVDVEGEESDRKMEEDALEALKALKVDGKGATHVADVPPGDQAWRTARWEERGSVISEYADASEMKVIQEPATTGADDISASVLEDTAAHVDIAAHAEHEATLPPAEDTFSTITVKGNNSPSEAVAPLLTETEIYLIVQKAKDDPLPSGSPISTIPALAPTEILAPSPQKAGQTPTRETFSAPVKTPGTPTTSLPTTPGPPVAGTPKIPTKAEKADEEAAKNAPAPAMGTHRFTLLDKEALQLIGAKKPSGFPSTFVAFLPKALAPTSKCPVCHKRLGNRPALQCDDCAVIVHVKCSHAAARNCHGGDGQ